MSSDDLERELAAIGELFDFGEYETEAYITILEHGSLTASEIADKTDIPQPRVYDTVRSLASSGLVELHESRPMRAIAINPEEAFDEVRSTLSDLVDGLSERYSAPARGEEVVSLVKSRQTILRYVEDVISSAEYELVLALTPDLLARYEDLLAERRDAGVTIELLVAPESEIPDPAEYDYARVATEARARRGVTTPVVAVADGGYAVYKPQEAVGNSDDRYGVSRSTRDHLSGTRRRRRHLLRLHDAGRAPDRPRPLRGHLRPLGTGLSCLRLPEHCGLAVGKDPHRNS